MRGTRKINELNIDHKRRGAAIMSNTQFWQKFIENPKNRYAIVSFWILVFIVLTLMLQLFIPYPIDDDTAYHFSVGQLIAKYGILHDFPWTPFSWQFGHYADKELLFHLLFVPLGGLGFVAAARVVGTLAGALVLTTLYLVLRAEKVSHAALWVLLTLTCSEFVFRLSLVRPHLLSITLALIVLWAYANGRLRILAVAAVIYPLSYVAFWQIPLILIVATEFARMIAGEQLRWKPGLMVIAGLSIGVALHPNTVNLLGINWIHMTDILFQNAWGRKVEFDNLGKEFNPYTVGDWGRYFAIVTLMVGASLVLGWKERKKSSLPLAFAMVAAVFGILTVRSLRFVEYFVPFTVAAMAVSSRALKERWLAPALLGVSLLYVLVLGTTPFKIMTTKTTYIDPPVAKYFEQSIPADSQVFTCGWDYTGNLMLALPGRRFVVAADPTLFYKKDPDLYRIWHRMPIDAPLDSVEAIRKLFRSRFVICLNYEAYWPFFDTLEKDPVVKTLYADNRWVLFDLGDQTAK
jgi:hypothetical protein